jgi:hypothetical protein
MLRIYRAFLRLYPGEFRDEYGRELSLVLADRLRDESSALARVFVWLHALAGLVIEAPVEHLRVLGADVRHALRLVRRETATTTAAVLILALGIGAATLVFSLANGLLLRPLPYAASDRLIALDEYNPGDSNENGTVALFVAFAALALTLAAAGFYAVLAYTVSLQTHEIGLRMALGASASGVRRMVMRHAMTLAASGLAIGVVAAAALAYLLRTQLYQVSPLDPVSYAIAPVIFLLTGALAAYLPGRRATRVDPLVALRHE